jgi:hypothetical protein
MTLRNIAQTIEQEVEKRRFGIRLAAPFFFFLTALLRCYLETHIIAPQSYFSYFVALHHVIWYFTTILAVILITHLILKVAVEKLLWLMYGAVLLMIPVIIVVIQGKSLMIDYLTGSFREIVMHILTFYYTYEQNLPLRAEIIAIFIGMTVVGYLYSRSLLRGLTLGAAVYLIGNLLAINWLNPFPNSKAVFIVHSALLIHPFMAVVFAHAVTFFSALAASRAGLITGGFRCRLLSAAIAAAVGSVYMALVAQSGWFSNPIDMVLTALPVWSTAFLTTLCRCRQQVSLSRWFWIIGLTVLFFQWAVLGPIYFHIGVARPLTTQEFWMLPHRPF